MVVSSAERQSEKEEIMNHNEQPNADSIPHVHNALCAPSVKDEVEQRVPVLPDAAGSDSTSTWWFAFDHNGETVQIDLLPGGKIRLWNMPTFRENISLEQARELALALCAAVEKAEQE